MIEGKAERGKKGLTVQSVRKATGEPKISEIPGRRKRKGELTPASLAMTQT